MGILNKVTSPQDLKSLSDDKVEELAAEIRQFLIDKVSVTGGHLGPNLGVVELTIALHRVFDSPRDPIVFDTSHQSYVHKILTGRADQFDTLRQKDGLSGYTDRGESEHDWTESSHASAAISVVDGLSKAFRIKGESRRNAIAVVGDGALTGGMCWEALNNVSADNERNAVIVVNDNGRSYSPTIGGLSENLGRIRAQHGYDELMEHGKKTLKSLGWVGNRTFDALRAFKEGVKSSVLPTEMFPELGMKYIGPVNGHDLEALDHALSYARDYEGPIIVHVVTEKGHGFAPAVNEPQDQMHSTGAIDPVTGVPKGKSQPGWTAVFSEELIAAAEKRDDIVAITAAMAGPTGLMPFADKFPDRFFDVGIAEQHAMASASGLALGGLHPVVAIYSTFLNRAFDQLLMDIALLKQPVTIVLDRAGVTGSDGASHNGVWDMSLTTIIPGIHVAAPRDGQRLRELFQESLDIDSGPSVVRFPKGNLLEDMDAVATTDDGVDILYESSEEVSDEESAKKVLIISIGAMAARSLGAADILEGKGMSVTVVDPRWLCPVAPSLIEMADAHDIVVVAEDGMMRAGVGSLFDEAFSAAEVDTPLRRVAFPSIFPKHGSRGEVLEEVGMDAEGIAATVTEWVDNLH
ncbi:1-deoxy-D-xylulose-5-phosphate synthase [Corynebacterium casei]|uniref:1-deoxy-D-xylulose-5-phosphate synthase n=2 Tax=Corynebacterium casei TaxID=160386 RepID=A0ABM5PPJ7_9CORY|nr:1-deoxy-D-xylulose-5-phosphate synthase [Corynebacterium casei]AHI19901.1 1-deoxy-D-xylulose-5-phosphate synthase [Corynebacterium casei LMG S-19264]MDN5739720.1 1-deoxy-D-xylulose-5-phosphate synthase [Corynebacterium casei]MDN5840011.1 1-deoxy-D-xylulose-5-phosphate synthase [Corynebacterium casei]MDN6273624.1 1-deoxy-D-xylulose-5-phosphate synthase [Corynebacterium casei]MDN6495257.1 1-deoxy-D-xylulose-5-phosphate synthase [Corynebacterium casei]